ncbi:hypothetical protein K3U94_03815 [Mycolicibacter heraklionensis]|uniref:Secreted protein n=1 Tax=Mycolicibacter heraklionensis TaxID=512402 RepID=A0A9X7ZFW0_9MYCO|nr:hypothetical protein [Mycolicibacter heraklionensis]QZA08449.1 hypothetical protein K3U94_03815 [Mycolicibacter heraklionensis]
MIIRARTLKRWVIGASPACLAALGVIVAPGADASPLPNGLDVSCTADSGVHTTCIIGGCPRVNGDYVVDAVHVLYNGRQEEYGFKCINGQTARWGVQTVAEFTIGVQGCRKKDLEGDWCGPWADYTYKPPAAPAPAAGAAPAPGPAEKPVRCTGDGRILPPGSDCSKTPPPAKPEEKPPTNQVRMQITKQLGNVKVNVTNNAPIAGNCLYKANEVNGAGIPVSRAFDIAANGSTTLNFIAPLPGQTYHVVLSCHGDFKGKSVEFGHQEQDVS